MKKASFMQGRYGFDTLFFVITAICALAFLLSYTVLNNIPHITPDGIRSVAGLAMIINTSRAFSKDISKRKSENIRFLTWFKGLSAKDKPENSNVIHPEKNAMNGKIAYCKCGQQLVILDDSNNEIVICPRCGSRNLIKK